MLRVVGDHLERLWDEGPPHGGFDVLVDFLNLSAGFFLGYQLDAWQNSSIGTLGQAFCSSAPANTSKYVV